MKSLSLLHVGAFLAVAVVAASLPAQTITFAQPKQISANSPAGDVASVYLTGNFNGNGNTDVIARIESTQNSISYYLSYEFLSGDGAGNFSIKGVPTSGTPNALLTAIDNPANNPVVADVNGDGKDDVITLVGGCLTYEMPCGNGAFTVYLSDGNGKFTAGYTHALPAGTATGLVGDFNKDGKPDVAVFIHPSDLDSIYQGSLMVFLNQGNGSFTVTSQAVPDITNSGVVVGPASAVVLATAVVGDFNGDKNLDLAITLPGGGAYVGIYTFSGNGKGGFAADKLRYELDSPPDPSYVGNNMLAGDLNGDGRTDLVISVFPQNDQPGNQRIPSLLANASGGFAWNSAIYLPSSPTTILLSDLNGDGKPDLVYFGANSSSVAIGGIYPGRGNGAFVTPHTSINVTPGLFPVPLGVAVPLKKGALPSLIISNYRPTLELLVNTTKK
jgi:hypothetical protein